LSTRGVLVRNSAPSDAASVLSISATVSTKRAMMMQKMRVIVPNRDKNQL